MIYIKLDPHPLLYFLLFLYLYFYSLPCIITHVNFFNPTAHFLRFGSRLWKVNIDKNWNLFLSLFVSENPRYLWLYFSRECVFICYLFPLDHENRSWQVFLFRDSQKLCLRQHQLRNSLVAFYPQKANPYIETFLDLCKLETLRDVEGSNIYTESVTLKRITYSYM